MRWTQAQQKTIETRDRNILVSAAAGSGKTTVLIERIKQLVLRDRIDIDRFLITTFTNAAAAEMKEKMERAIQKEMDLVRAGEADPSVSDPAYLQRQLDLLPQASISTFHTFSLGVMREYFYLTDLQPGFAVGDETRLSIMRRESVNTVFERRFEEGSPEFHVFLRNYSSDRSDDRLKEQLLDIYQKMRSIPGYMDWAAERIERMRAEDPLEALGIDLFLLEECMAALEESVRWYRTAAELLHTEATDAMYQKVRGDLTEVERLRDTARQVLIDADGDADHTGDTGDASLGKELEQLGAALQAFRPARMVAPAAEKEAYEPLKEEVKWLREKGKKCLDGLRSAYFTQTMEENGQILRRLADDTSYFVGLIADMEAIYREKKREQNVVDFDDCMHYALEILRDPGAAADLRDRFCYIFIDEYQDSNLLQEEIIGRIAREDNLFMVGDVKQSIYKFRLAEPEIFRQRYEDYRSGRDPRSIRIDLNSNFRSCANIRSAVNRIFEEIMEGYDEDARLNGPEPEGPDPGPPVSLHILSKGPAEDGPAEDAADAKDGDAADTPVSPADPEAAEAMEELTETEIIARIIREHIGRPITDRDGTVRPIGYGDIAVLSRGGSAIPQIERYLNNEGIPAFGEAAGGYYETVEIQVFLNLLKLISNPRQDVPLISAMYSVVFDFTPAELAQIRIECREGAYYEAVDWYAENGRNTDIRDKIRNMKAQIVLWKEIGRTVPLDELMRRLLYETGYYDYCSGLPTGGQRISNLRLLLEKAADYEASSHLGLYGFLSYVEAMRRTRQKVSEASLVGEGKDVVHVMTVHKSKGLEFPVVILAGAGRRISASSEGRAPVMHRHFAIGLPEVDRQHHWERKTILQKAIAGKKTRENLEEEIRILYVALTRPMQKLAIVASVRDLEKLQHFPGRGSFLEMIYGTFRDMAEEDPSLAEIVLHQACTRGRFCGPDAVAAAATADAGEIHNGEQCCGSPENDSFEIKVEAAADTGDSSNGIVDAVPDPAEIARRLSWQYPYAQAHPVKTKYSVTELSRREDGQTKPEQQKIPQLRTLETEVDLIAEAGTDAGTGMYASKKLTAAEIGTAMHAVMERIDFAAALDEGLPYIRQTAEQLEKDGILTDAEFHAIRPENIDGFFRSAVGIRAALADELHREQEFLLQKEVDGVPAIVQGIIDCWFRDKDGLVLIDYKNSWIGSDEDEAAVIERYAGQVRLYGEALELALGRPVDEAWLYLFRSRKFVSVPLTESSPVSSR